MIEKIKVVWGMLLFLPFIIWKKEILKNTRLEDDVRLRLCRWNRTSYVGWRAIVFLLIYDKEFRNIFYFRCPMIPKVLRTILARPMESLYITDYIEGEINDIAGGGLKFIHAFSTIITAKSIGKGCIFRQLSTIGSKGTDRPLELPIIGNNVDFGANVTCIGGITIGDNAVIGAGSVVVKDVPTNAIVAGNPARVIGYR